MGIWGWLAEKSKQRQPNLMGAAKWDVVLYSRAGCHLCEDAYELLSRAGCCPRIHNIDNDPELVSQYGDCVPVVSINGKLRFRGRVNPILLARLIHAESLGRPVG